MYFTDHYPYGLPHASAPATARSQLNGLSPLDCLNGQDITDVQSYAEARLLTATYYDDYRFLSSIADGRLLAARPAAAVAAPKGLPTGTLTAVLGPDGIPADSIAPMLTVNYYDAEERVIATATLSHRGDLLCSTTSYTRGGLPVTTATTLTAHSGEETDVTATHSLDYTTAYDSHGRITSTQLSRDGTAPLTLSANAYDRLGRLQSTAYHGGMRRTYAYDMHGWLTDWHCGFLGQQLLYAGGSEPSYTGRVSSKISNSYGHFDRYDYSYDRLGRLTSAAFSRRMPLGATADNGSPDADFSTAYTYDLQGNMLTLTRQGMIAPSVYGQIDDITATFSGNQLLTLRDDAPTVLLEASLDLPCGEWAGSDFAYDANGNQMRDMSRGVSDVTYNVLNLPQRVEFSSGARIDYLYGADGTKLAETVYDADGSMLSRRDWVGQFEFVADTLERMLLPEGYITAADSTFHAYIPDYQGNIVGVYNSATNTLEQFTDYYPYGLPHASATAPTVNRRKYGAKELTTDHGLNLYDFAARFHNPVFPAFTTPDPLAEKYYPTSPYLYCGADPVNLIDPTGMDIDALPLIWTDKALSLDMMNQIINDLNEITGLNIFISDGSLDYEKNENGDPVVSHKEVDGATTESGSSTARNILIEAISSPETITTSYTNKGCKGGDGIIAIDPSQIAEIIENANGVDGKTLGYGMTFLHEMLHNRSPNYLDSQEDIGTGIVVDTMNQIRSELNAKGYNFGERMNYRAFPINSRYQIIPFDQSSFKDAKNGLFPAPETKFIRITINNNYKQ